MPAILINRDAKAKKLDPKLVNDESLGDATLAIPRLYGAKTTRTTGTTAAATVRDEAFFEQAEKRLSGQYVSALRELYEFSCAEADTVKWGRGTTGSFNH